MYLQQSSHPSTSSLIPGTPGCPQESGFDLTISAATIPGHPKPVSVPDARGHRDGGVGVSGFGQRSHHSFS